MSNYWNINFNIQNSPQLHSQSKYTTKTKPFKTAAFSTPFPYIQQIRQTKNRASPTQHTHIHTYRAHSKFPECEIYSESFACLAMQFIRSHKKRALAEMHANRECIGPMHRGTGKKGRQCALCAGWIFDLIDRDFPRTSVHASRR